MERYLLNQNFVLLTWQTVLLSCLVAFLVSTCIARIYEMTYQGLSYSRSLVHSLILGSIISCMIMLAIGDNLARGIGIVGSLAIIRFRTNLRDPLELVFVFAALGSGVAAGVQSYVTAITGGAVFCLTAWILKSTALGARRRHDGMLRFQIPASTTAGRDVESIIKKETRYFSVMAMRDVAQGEMIDYTYQVKFREPEAKSKLMKMLEHIEGLHGLTYLSHQSDIDF